MKSNIDGVVPSPLPANGLAGKKILFTTFPADGHVNPLTGFAVHLKWLGCDVRWYTSTKYEEKITGLGIQHYPFKKALDISNIEEHFPERKNIHGKIAKMKYDIINAFVLRGPEYYADVMEIQQEFEFDAVVADCLFPGIPFITDKMNVPVLSMGIVPLTEYSRDLPPTGLGMMPDYSWFGKVKQAGLRFFSDRVLFREPNRVMHQILSKYGIDHMNSNIFDIICKKATLLAQSGTPGFEYYRSDISKNVRFVGALLPFRKSTKKEAWFDQRLNRYDHVIIATQGTVETDVNKLLVPTLEAFKDSDVLLIVTTGGSKTNELREKYPHDNIIIEDFIAFADIMPYADAYITNGGYGGVMLGIEYQLPMVVAGVHEGKNEINARIGYFKLGINLNTEKPKSEKIREAVKTLLKDKQYKENVTVLQKEFKLYDPTNLCAGYLKEMLEKRAAPVRKIVVKEAETMS